MEHSSNEESSEIISMFKEYSKALDEVNDRYERLVKLSRDLTIGSKRLISLLQRGTKGAEGKEQVLQKGEADLLKLYEIIFGIANELEKEEYWRYHRAFSPGLQEFVEAVTFMRYLKDDTLLDVATLHKMLGNAAKKPLGNFHVSLFDYLMGVADLTGELMRFSTTSVSAGDVDTCYKIMDIMKGIHEGFGGLPNSFVYRSKIEVMDQSVQKVENVCFDISVRGSEYPSSLLNTINDRRGDMST